MNEKAFCQSCAMPLEKPEDFGTNADMSRNEDYCHYCYEKGQFTSEGTMDEMIESCVPFTVEAGVYQTAEEARAAMQSYFPQLKRWAKA